MIVESLTQGARHAELLGLLARGGSGLAMRTCMRRGRCGWPLFDGATTLLAWQGARLPIPTIGGEGPRQAQVVGLALGPATQVDTYPDFAPGANTVWHFALASFGGGGVTGGLPVQQIVTRAFDGGGAPLGLMPNPPASVSARRLPRNLPLVTWTYSAFGQQTAPAQFLVFEASAAADFNFAAPLASVAFERGRTRYAWSGAAALSVGAVRYYTVRAVSAGGVGSLFPRLSGGPSPSYAGVTRGESAKLVIPAAPPGFVSEPAVEIA